MFQNDVMSLRLRTGEHEMMIALHDNFTLVVVQQVRREELPKKLSRVNTVENSRDSSRLTYTPSPTIQCCSSFKMSSLNVKGYFYCVSYHLSFAKKHALSEGGRRACAIESHVHVNRQGLWRGTKLALE